MKTFRNLKAVLFDWAGTTIDYGSLAPTIVFQEILAQVGVPITMAEAREPMGMAKRDHIAAVLAMPRVAQEWQRVHGRPSDSSTIDDLYAKFLPLQREIILRYSHVIPGVPEVVDACRRRGLKIGSSTGYTQELMEGVLMQAEREGYKPDVCVCPNEVPAGRPAPWLNLRAAELLHAHPVEHVVVVDDTKVGIEAARNAGMWAIGVSKTGNAMGMSQADVEKMSASLLESRLAEIRVEMLGAGAHEVIEGVPDLMPVLEDLDQRCG